MRWRLLVTLSIALWFAHLSAASEACLRVNDHDGLPLRNASVVATNLLTASTNSGTTDEAGIYCFKAIPEGLYSFEAGRRGFLNVRYYPVHVKVSDPLELEFRLPFGEIEEGSVTPEAMISGTLRRTGTPLADATICLLSESTGKSIRCVQTTELGEYAIAAPPGIYEVEIRLGRGGEVHPLFGRPAPPKPGSIHRMRLDASSPGDYRNVLLFPSDK